MPVCAHLGTPQRGTEVRPQLRDWSAWHLLSRVWTSASVPSPDKHPINSVKVRGNIVRFIFLTHTNWGVLWYLAYCRFCTSYAYSTSCLERCMSFRDRDVVSWVSRFEFNCLLDPFSSIEILESNYMSPYGIDKEKIRLHGIASRQILHKLWSFDIFL